MKRSRKQIMQQTCLSPVPRITEDMVQDSVPPVPQIMEETVEAIQPVPREGIHEQTIEEIGVFLAPQIEEAIHVRRPYSCERRMGPAADSDIDMLEEAIREADLERVRLAKEREMPWRALAPDQCSRAWQATLPRGNHANEGAVYHLHRRRLPGVRSVHEATHAALVIRGFSGSTTSGAAEAAHCGWGLAEVRLTDQLPRLDCCVPPA